MGTTRDHRTFIFDAKNYDQGSHGQRGGQTVYNSRWIVHKLRVIRDVLAFRTSRTKHEWRRRSFALCVFMKNIAPNEFTSCKQIRNCFGFHILAKGREDFRYDGVFRLYAVPSLRVLSRGNHG